MNLRIAENIRRLRRENGLTQAQLADRLGVSYQAISRWENETTYPDIELLPAIAALFGVTVDYLLGGTSESRQESLHRDWGTLDGMTDPNARVAHLRQMHRDYPDDWYLFVRLVAEVPTREEKLRLTDEILRDCPIPYLRSLAIRQMIRAEDEERVMAYLYQNNVFEECWDELLEDRYRARGDTEAYRRKKQDVLLECLRKAMARLTAEGTGSLPADPAVNEEGARTVLAMIAAITHTNLTAEHPVSGDGGPDLWFGERIWAGITIACALSARGEAEAAIAVLEDAADLITSLRTLDPDTVLSYHSPGMELIVRTRDKLGGVQYISDHMDAQFAHSGFAALREDERYAARFLACRAVFVENT